MKGSLIILAFFAVGILCGLYRWIPFDFTAHRATTYTLYVLLFSVGFSIGNDKELLRSFRSLDPRVMWLPAMTIAGTLAGCAVASLFIPDRPTTDVLAVGSGLAYYSLSSILITEYRGVELGTVALLANVLRELITLLLAPLLVRYFGKLAPISVGGASTIDITMPVISRYSGREYAVVCIYHGIVMDFSVPFLVTLFCLI
ncbi:MAG: lysine exporter LysO family protein [Prevotellaceae bacterium]|jgi:uncharacterized membrane protein YbjE (DUF340 family)|nr:lysine exporter LysO family protein [Prevotellaceae bacterium]